MMNFRTSYKYKAAFVILLVVIQLVEIIISLSIDITTTEFWTVIFPIFIAQLSVISLGSIDLYNNYPKYLYFKDYNKSEELRDKYKLIILNLIREELLQNIEIHRECGLCQILKEVKMHYIPYIGTYFDHYLIPEFNRNTAIQKFGAYSESSYWWEFKDINSRLKFIEYLIETIENYPKH